MKKIILLLCATTLFVACSKSDNQASVLDVNSILPKKIIFTSNGAATTVDFTFNGKKIVKLNESDGTYTNYTYTNNLITKIEGFTSDNNSYGSTILEYNTLNQLISTVQINVRNNSARIKNFVYNADNTISYKATATENFKIYADKIERYYDNDPNSLYTRTFTFDTKNNPYKNIEGFDKIWFSMEEKTLNYVNNISSIKYTLSGSGQSGSISDNIIQYNANNFPTVETITDYRGTVNETKKEYFY